MREGGFFYKAEALPNRRLPREEKRDIYRRLRESGLSKSRRFPYNESGKAQAEAEAEKLRAKVREAGFTEDEAFVWCGETYLMAL